MVIVAIVSRRTMTRKTPEIVDVDTEELEDLLRRAEQALDADDTELIRRVFESYNYVIGVLEHKHTSLNRLRKLLFGARTEKTAAVVGGKEAASSTEERDATEDSPGSSPETVEGSKAEPESSAPPSGHGRNGADAYRGAEVIDVPHESLQAGDSCPACNRGTVYACAPGVLVRIVGQPPLGAKVYRLQKLRCHLCGKVFTANAPESAGECKYDATSASMIALLKYGSGMPFNRLAGLQADLEIPLPASTQWDVIRGYAPAVVPAFEELIRQAAQGDVLYHDDTTARILELMGEGASPSDEGTSSSRKGLYTSGVVATREGCRIALFFSGRKHAGENLADVLKHRAAKLDRPIQMCDALSRNMSDELKTIVANCMAHGRRQFVDVYDSFPAECEHVLEVLRVIYHNDAIARQRGMSAEERLLFHQSHSQATMEFLHDWLQQQLDEKRVEPNSGLGGAIKYLLNHWKPLTLFLRKAGAPLDNNICERALKKAILARKNSLFYRTRNGARVGDMYMSLIHTCELCQANPHQYLTALLRHQDAVASAPEQWMPWNYRHTLEARSPAA